jgi:short-subunit dehydrogenase
MINVNYTGAISILNIVANDFEKERRGFIVGVSSVAGDRGRKANYIYGSAKAGFSAYLSGLRNRLNDSGVQVLTVKPGFVNTKMTEGLDLPPKLTASPSEVAEDIFNAQQKGRNILYTKPIWMVIMLIIKHIPEFIFKKMSI